MIGQDISGFQLVSLVLRAALLASLILILGAARHAFGQRGDSKGGVFSDGFESGNASRWSAAVGVDTRYYLGDLDFRVEIKDMGAQVRLNLLSDSALPFTTFKWTFVPARAPVSATVGVPVVVTWPCQRGAQCTFTPEPVMVKFAVKRP